MRLILFKWLLITSLFGRAQYTHLVWSDEFEGSSNVLDSSKWSYDIGNGCPDNCGWGNRQQEYYTSDAENSRIENGLLIIEVHKKETHGYKYSSARIHTRNSASWREGRIDVRARLPRGRGVWPAIWMLPQKWEYGGWPYSGEIDIMEHVGWAPDSIFGTVHTQNYNHIKGTQKGKTIAISDVSLHFHTYSIIWNKKQIDFLVDDKKYFTYVDDGGGPDSWPFDKAFYLIMNVAVGGNFGGVHGIDETIWPQRMEIDYVRVYQ
ncbi:MAG: glycoside hydrolase family 16 protein [Saprospiraceae bacterium]|nr:glycoside hydrolase family 16 protein [Saprospiraceae bacterium]